MSANRLDNRVKTQRDISLTAEELAASEETAVSTKDILIRVEDLFKQLVVEFKINNKILNEVHDLEVNELDIK